MVRIAAYIYQSGLADSSSKKPRSTFNNFPKLELNLSDRSNL